MTTEPLGKLALAAQIDFTTPPLPALPRELPVAEGAETVFCLPPDDDPRRCRWPGSPACKSRALPGKSLCPTHCDIAFRRKGSLIHDDA